MSFLSSLGLSAATSALSGLFGGAASAMDYKESKKLMKYQHDMAVADWERQNAYNTPTAQMQRLKDAGLNPYLMYGQGTTGVSSSSVQQPQFTKIDKYSRMADAINTSIQQQLAIKMQQAQIKQMKTQNRLIDAQITTESEKQANMRVDKLRKQFDLDFANDTRSNLISEISLRVDTARRNLDLLKGHITKQVYEITGQILDNANKRATYNEILARTGNLKSLTNLNYANASAVASLINLRVAQEALVWLQSEGQITQNEILHKVSKLKDQEIKKAIIEIREKGVEEYFYRHYGTKNPGGGHTTNSSSWNVRGLGGHSSSESTPYFVPYQPGSSGGW